MERRKKVHGRRYESGKSSDGSVYIRKNISWIDRHPEKRKPGLLIFGKDTVKKELHN